MLNEGHALVTLIRDAGDRGLKTQRQLEQGDYVLSMPYEYLQQLWRKHDPELLGWLRQEAVEWRRDPVIMRIHRPTRPDKARMLGYKAKQGIVMVRVRVRTGGARKPRPSSGRRPKAMGSVKFTRAISSQRIGENRVLRKYPNMTLTNSYHLFSDGKNHWYEVILVDRSHPANQD